MALTNKLTAIGDAIRAKTGSSDKLTLDGMASAITNLPTGGGIDPSALTFTGSLEYFNNYGVLDNLLTTYGAQCSFTDVFSLSQAFYNSKKSEYPIAIFGDLNNGCDLQYCFNGSAIKQLPSMKNIKPTRMGYFLSDCHYLTTIPDDYADTWDFTSLHSATNGSGPCMSACFSLRNAPKFIKYIYNSSTSSIRNPFKGLLNHAYNIDEIIGYPCPPLNLTSNMFGSSNLSELNRIKDFTFDMLDENTPYTRNWTSQTIDLGSYIGYSSNGGHQVSYGLTKDTEITDAASYQLLKDNPDSWTMNYIYSRYNHDSAVRTIKSLPDCSASGGTNTIQFAGDMGRATDGGAISNLTEEEIAVATAKGWTVSIF